MKSSETQKLWDSPPKECEKLKLTFFAQMARFPQDAQAQLMMSTQYPLQGVIEFLTFVDLSLGKPSPSSKIKNPYF
jgi:hypothetical protein